MQRAGPQPTRNNIFPDTHTHAHTRSQILLLSCHLNQISSSNLSLFTYLFAAPNGFNQAHHLSLTHHKIMASLNSPTCTKTCTWVSFKSMQRVRCSVEYLFVLSARRGWHQEKKTRVACDATYLFIRRAPKDNGSDSSSSFPHNSWAVGPRSGGVEVGGLGPSSPIMQTTERVRWHWIWPRL